MTNFYLPLLLLFIFGNIICDTIIYRSFERHTQNLEFFLFFFTLSLQIIAAPIQAAVSDLYCRKKSLIVALLFAFLALILSMLSNSGLTYFSPVIFIVILFKGAFGNIIPLSLAAIADTQKKNVRFSFGLATSAYAAAYLALTLSNKYIPNKNSEIFYSIFFLFLLIACLFFFKDVRDKNEEKPFAKKWNHVLSALITEIKLVLSSLKSRHLQYGLVSFFLWEISLYSILLLYIDFNVTKLSNVSMFMLYGYGAGIVFLKIFKKIKDQKMIKIGYNFSALSLIPFFTTYPFLSEQTGFFLLAGCYFFHTLGNALLGSTLFAVISKEGLPNEQGRNYGLIESVDTIAFLVSVMAIMLHDHFKLNLLYIIAFSYLTVTLSWIPYAKFIQTASKR